MEIWKDVKGFEGLYKVSNLGRVKSMNYKKSGKEGLLKIGTKTNGYEQVNLYKNKTMNNFYVHTLVAISFLNHNKEKTKKIVDHVNNNRADNRLDNLQIITHRYNTSKDKKGCSSIYTGVYWSKPSKKWMSRIRVDSEERYLGLYDDEKEASIAYQKELKKIESI